MNDENILQSVRTVWVAQEGLASDFLHYLTDHQGIVFFVSINKNNTTLTLQHLHEQSLLRGTNYGVSLFQRFQEQSPASRIYPTVIKIGLHYRGPSPAIVGVRQLSLTVWKVGLQENLEVPDGLK